MQRIITLLLFLSMSMVVMTGAYAKDAPSARKKADIIKLLGLNGTERIVEPFSMIVTQSYMQSLGNCPNCSPKIPDVVRAETQAVLRAHLNGPDGLIERQALVYHERFSHAEIMQLIEFYSSPIGRKTVAESGELMRETVGVSQQWGRELSPEIRKQIDLALTKAGIKPTPPSAPPAGVIQPPLQPQLQPQPPSR